MTAPTDTVYCDPKRHQWDAWEATKTHKVVWMCGGLGAGKTWAMVWWCWMMAAEWATEVDGLLFEPDFATYEDTFLTLWRRCIPGEGTLWKAVNTRSGGRQLQIYVRKSRTVTIYVRSAMNSQNVMRSEGLTTIGWVAIDEPARMLVGDKAFTNSVGRARNKITGWDHNPIFMVGSPRGLNHWTANVMGCTQDHPDYGYTIGYEPNPVDKPGYFIRACKTADNADNLRENYERDSRIAFGEALAAQEFNASLMHSSGMVLPEFDIRRHGLPDSMLDELWARTGRDVFGAADWGFNRAASGVYGWNNDREFLALDGIYPTGWTVIQQGRAMIDLQRKWGRDVSNMDGERWIRWYADPSRPEEILLLRRGFEDGGKMWSLSINGARGGAGSWQIGIDMLRSLMDMRRGLDHPAFPPGNGLGRPRFFLPQVRCKELAGEMQAYRYKVAEAGKPVPEEHDPLCDDHWTDTARYAAFTTATAAEIQAHSHKGMVH